MARQVSQADINRRIQAARKQDEARRALIAANVQSERLAQLEREAQDELRRTQQQAEQIQASNARTNLQQIRRRIQSVRRAPYVVNWDEIQKLPPAERLAAEQRIMRVRDGIERNPLWRFHPHAKQAQFMAAHERMRWFLGGNRSGKTTTVVVQAIIDALDSKDVPPHLRIFQRWPGPIRQRMIGVTQDQVENVLVETLREWLPHHTLLTREWRGSFEKERRILRFANGSLILFNTYEQPPQRHAGVKLHRVIFDEEPPQDIFNENSARLIDYGGDMLCSMTPIDGLTWMYDRFYIAYERGDLRHTTVVTVDMDDNPHLDQVQKEIALSGYSNEEREARKTGRFVHFHGRVYPEFDDSHVIPTLEEIPDEATVYVGIDPGIRHMAAATFFWHRPDDVLVQFDEVCVKDMNVAGFCEQIRLTLMRWKLGEPAMYIIDPSARNRQMGTGQSLQSEFAQAGIYAWPGQNDIRAGINAVKVRLENGRLLIAANCPTTIVQARKYRWQKPSRRGQIDGPERPVASDDHTLDTWRYICMLHPAAPLELIETPFMGEATAAVRQEIREAGRTKSFVL